VTCGRAARRGVIVVYPVSRWLRINPADRSGLGARYARFSSAIETDVEGWTSGLRSPNRSVPPTSRCPYRYTAATCPMHHCTRAARAPSNCGCASNETTLFPQPRSIGANGGANEAVFLLASHRPRLAPTRWKHNGHRWRCAGRAGLRSIALPLSLRFSASLLSGRGCVTLVLLSPSRAPALQASIQGRFNPRRRPHFVETGITIIAS